MGYSLGIDLGATTCVVALRRGASVDVRPIGDHAPAMPAVALGRDDGTVAVGEWADARSAYEPTLVARHIVSHLGDGGPLEVDGRPVDARALTGALVREAIARAAPAGDGPPDQVVLTYPLLPGPALEQLLADAAADAFGPGATLVPAPVAAVARHAAEGHLGDDVVVAVVDVGGSSVDVTLVRRSPDAFDLVGDPATLADLGGVDLDSAVLSLVEGAIGDVSSTVITTDSAGMLALRRLRASCRTAKERLSEDDRAVVEVALPQARGRVEITREAFERTVEPALVEIADLVLTAIDDAGLIQADVRAVIVTGGSARIPLLVDVLRRRLTPPVLIDDDPEATVALGAALFADVADDVGGQATGPAEPAPLPAADHAPGLGPAGALGAGTLGAAGALGAGLAAGAAAADAAEPPATAVPELADLSSIPPIGPVTGGGPLPWETGGPAPADPWGSAHDPWPSGQVPATTGDWGGPTDPWTTGPHAPAADPWAPAADATTVAPADPWAAPVGAAPTDTGSVDPWAPAGPTDTGSVDPWPSGATDTGAADPWTPAADATTVARSDQWDAGDNWPPPPSGADSWAERGQPAGDATGAWDDWPAATTALGATGDSFATGLTPGTTGRAREVEWGQTSDDEVRRLTTSDTDPFGRPGTLTARLRDRGERDDGDDDDGGRLDLRVLIGGVVAALGVIIAGGYFAFAAMGGNDDPAIAVADTSPLTTTTTMPPTTTTTVAPTTTAAPTTTEAPTTTTTRPRPRPTTTTTAAPTPPPPPPVTEPPTTATTEPPTTTSSTTTTTTTVP
jgi:hypothetical protein